MSTVISIDMSILGTNQHERGNSMAPLATNDQIEQLLAATKQLFTTGVLSHSGHANLSARLDATKFVISTTGMVRNLSKDDFAIVNLDGKTLEGTLEPTNLEIVDMHSTIYKLRPNAGAVIHTHSPSVLAFALANRPLSCRYEALLRFGQATDVPVASWGPRGSQRSIEAIKTVVETNPDTISLILANHGLLAFGASPQATAGLISALEESAAAEIAATQLGGAVDFPSGALEMVRASMAKVQNN